MTGSTLIIELHGYRGFHMDGGPLGRVLVFGFISAIYVPFLLSDWLAKRITDLRAVIGVDVEMAARGVVPCERINAGKPLHVSSERK